MELFRENELIFALARTEVSPELREKIRSLLKEPLNWDYLLEMVWCHRIAPLWYYNLRQNGLSHYVPDKVMSQLRLAFLATLARNISIYEELEKLVQELKEEKIDLLVLKGADLAIRVYQNIGLRYFSDVDLLIHREDLPRTDQILKKHGYSPSEATHSLNFYHQYHFHLIYTKRGEKGLTVEVHWNLTRPSWDYKYNLEEIWESAVTLSLRKFSVKVLSCEDLLLYLSLHAAQDAFSRIDSLCDILGVICRFREELNWKEIIRRSEKYKMRATLSYCLKLIDQLFSLPKCQLLSELKSPTFFSPSLGRKEILAGTTLKGEPNLSTKLFITEGFSQKIKFIGKLLVPDQEQLRDVYSLTSPQLSISQRTKVTLRGVKLLSNMMNYMVKSGMASFIQSTFPKGRPTIWEEDEESWLDPLNSEEKGWLTTKI